MTPGRRCGARHGSVPRPSAPVTRIGAQKSPHPGDSPGCNRGFQMKCAAENEHRLKDETTLLPSKKRKPLNAIRTCCLRPPSSRIKAVCAGTGQGGRIEESPVGSRRSHPDHGAVTGAFDVTHLESTAFLSTRSPSKASPKKSQKNRLTRNPESESLKARLNNFGPPTTLCFQCIILVFLKKAINRI